VFGLNKTKKNTARVEIKGINAVKKGLKDLGMTSRQARTEINQALRPAGNMLARGLKRAYKRRFNKTQSRGRRYNPQSRSYRQGKPTAQTMGVVTARRSRQPGLFVGPLLRKINPHYWRKGPSRNLAAMQIEGYKTKSGEIKMYKNIFEETSKSMGDKISNKARKDLDRLLDKMIKKAGF